MIDGIAMWIGYVVMSAAGMAASVLLLSLAIGRIYAFYTMGQDTDDLIEAIEEWREKHPDKFAKQRKRHDG